jgi:hypothetical protein
MGYIRESIRRVVLNARRNISVCSSCTIRSFLGKPSLIAFAILRRVDGREVGAERFWRPMLSAFFIGNFTNARLIGVNRR